MKRRGAGVPGIHGNEVRMKQVGSLIVPETVAEEIGFGCDRCDDHELVPVTMPQADQVRIISAFRNKHRGHGILHTLEKRNGRVVATSEVPGLV